MVTGLKYVSEAANSGYGRAARGYLRALSRSGVGLTWTPMLVGNGWNMYLEPYEGQTFDDELGHLCNRPVAYDAVLVHLIGTYFRRWRELEPGSKLIGVTVWETDRAPESTAAHLGCLDGLIVPCRWNAQVLRASGLTCPILVAPHIHESPDTCCAMEVPGVSPETCVFYSIGDWKDRKGMHLTVEAFCRAFSRTDPVALVLKTSHLNERRRKAGRWWQHIGRRIHTAEREIRQIARSHPAPPQIVALTQEFSETEMHSLHGRGDCYISLTRAEGWGLGAYEAAFSGNPVIMTGHGGQLDFLPSDLSSHIDFRLVPAAPEGQIDLGYRGHLWAEPDLDHAAELMRATYMKRAEAASQGLALQAHVRANFSPEKITRDILEFVASV